MLKVETFPIGSYSCNCSLIYSEDTKEAIIIDPGNDKDKLLAQIKLRDLNVVTLLHTHAHFDHIGHSKHIAEATGAKICLHKDDLNLYRSLPAQAMMFGQPPSVAGKVDHFIENEEEFSLSDPHLKNFIKSLHTPGHTKGSCCFYTEALEEPLLFSGDTLFSQSIGRTDLPGGDFEEIKKSIKDKLYVLPDETLVISGHGPMTKIYDEKKGNPFVQA